jgi:hypothetical protein
MYALMCYKTDPSPEWFITHIRSIRAATTVYVLMCYQSALLTE